MGKSNDSITRRKNKRIIKKQESKSKVSTRIAAIIAAKKRRLTGKRSSCQGMCFSLPTPEDPFNDRHGKPEFISKKKKTSKPNKKFTDKKGSMLSKGKVEKVENVESVLVRSISFMGPEIAINIGKPTSQIIKWDDVTHSWKELGSEKNTECPSKFLVTCLNSIQNAGDIDSLCNKPLFANEWGLEFWNCYTNGKDVLEIDGADSKMEQIAWMASTATDTISMKEKEGLSFAGPFLLYLVPTQEKAHKVRQVCKTLKIYGIHTVSLHSGASMDHQIQGLKSCEPEFLVSTPERLLELLSLKAVDISGVSLLVIDGLEAPFKGDYFDGVKSIRQFISGNPRTVVFCECKKSNSSISVVQKLLGRG
ncbi:hypothetical protein ACJIZ3_022816 [Penstemon smallii]|uniref:DEAD/DEAH-box helicase domain-containing protein n=1 Tax=Penstemon smallii TaxID=265156 RepID=A0ABD3TPJ6_9LAMI